MEAARSSARTLSPGRRGAVRIAAVLMAAALLGAGLGFGLHSVLHRSTPVAGPAVRKAPITRNGFDGQATWPAGTQAAPAIDRLRDQSGHRFALSGLRGRSVALVFFDSHCNQECPLEGRELAAAEQSLPAAQRPILVAVSVNPLDTPSSARRAARAWGLAGIAGWHWLTGRRAQLARVWAAYHIYVGAPVNGDIPHTEALMLIDRHGYERSAYLFPFAQRFVSHDLRVLAGERRA